MKKLFALLLAAGLLTACGGGESPAPDKAVSFRATVLENNTVSLLVEPAEGTAESKSADRVIVSTSGAKVMREDGVAGQVSDIAANDIVEIAYDGALAESYPAQINEAEAIQVVGHAEEVPGSATIPNPMKEYPEPVYPGFSLISYPREEDLEIEHCWLISEKIAQLDYKAGKAEVIFRAAKDDGSDISGVYFLFTKDEIKSYDTSAGSVAVRVRMTEAETKLYTWTKDGWAFSLYLPRTSEKAAEKLIVRFAEESAAEATA